MKQNFITSFDKVIGHEGGYTNDRNDRGNWTSGRIGVGELKGTKYGVSAMSYPKTDIKNLTLEDARDIYRRDFWDKCQCDHLPSGLDYIVFDAAINHGQRKAAELLQVALGVKADGAIGPQTISAAQKANPVPVLTEFAVRRMLFYTNISTFSRYGLGWTRRCFETCLQAVAMSARPTMDQSNVANENSVPEEQTSFFDKLFRRV